jgi:hypothetical protein
MRTFGTNDIHEKTAAQHIPDGGSPVRTDMFCQAHQTPLTFPRVADHRKGGQTVNKSAPPRTNPADEAITSSSLVLWTLTRSYGPTVALSTTSATRKCCHNGWGHNLNAYVRQEVI